MRILVRTLLRAGADPTYVDPEGMTVLHTAARWGLTSLMEIMASHVKDLNSIRPPLLHVAADRKLSNIRMYELLIKLGIDVNAGYEKNSFSRYGYGSSKYVCNAIHILATGEYWWYPKALKSLINAKANLEALDSKGETAIHVALTSSYPGSLSVARWYDQTLAVLIKGGADVNFVSPETGLTPLSSVLELRRGAKITQILRSSGAQLSPEHKPAMFSAL